MLSRLISLLRRIPAVKWAFTRLRPLPHGGSIDVAPIVADDAAAILADAAPAPDTSTAPLHSDADIAVATPVAENDTAVSVIAESPTAAPSDINVSSDPSEEAPAEVEVVAVEEASVSSVDIESEPVEVSDLALSSDTSPDLSTEVEPFVAEEISVLSAGLEMAPVDVPDVVINDDVSPGVSAEVEAVGADEAPAVLVDTEGSAADVPEVSTDRDPSPTVAIEMAPVPANDPPLVAAEPPSTEPAPALVSSSPETGSTPKAPARATEPVDRATLIRRRWAETGIRMWNPRLHGTGDAALNIQGRVELLPPAPGETMPQYDKLEFRMLGGQIVCEGVIVEAPAHGSQRSFTRLAEPRNPERAREPMRERQAALA